MANCRLLSFLFILSVFAYSVANASYADEEEDDDRYLALALRALMQREQRGVFDCNGIGQSCRGIVPCCGNLQCYWKDGYSLTTSGQCVECVQSGQLCQRDNQCCSPLVCQKDNTYDMNGRCNVKRATGQNCHENDQCASGRCAIKWYDKVIGKEGRCG